MQDIRTQPRPIAAPQRLDLSILRLLPQALVLVYLLAALLVFAFAPFLALRWTAAPFIGAPLGPNMIFSGGVADAWPLYRSGAAQPGDSLLAVDGLTVSDGAALQALLARRAPGDPVALMVVSPNGRAAYLNVTLTAFPAAARAGFYLPYLIGLLYLGVGVWVFSLRRASPAGRAFALLSVSGALGLGLLFDLTTTQRLTGLWAAALAVGGGSAVALALAYPQPDPLARRHPNLAILAELAAALPGLYALICLHSAAQPLAFARALRVEQILLPAVLLACLGGWTVRRLRAQPAGRPADGSLGGRRLVGLIALGGLVSLLPPLLGMLAAEAGWGAFSPYLLLSLAVFPLVAGYTVQRYRLLQADVVLSLGASYGLLALLVSTGYALVAAGLGLALGHLVAPGSPLMSGLIFFVLAMALIPLRELIQHMVDRVFFHGKQVYQERLLAFSGELTRTAALPGIVHLLRGYIAETLTPTAMHLFLEDPGSLQYTAVPDDSGRRTSDLRFSAWGGLAQRLGDPSGGSHLFLSPGDRLPALLEPERPRLALLGAQVFVPLPGSGSFTASGPLSNNGGLTGWLALGPRRSGDPYNAMQIDFVAALCHQAALAIERAQVVANLENHVREMNLLTRVAQGISITLSLDDILELVYAQTTQIIPAQYFRIMLFDAASGAYQYAFFLEDDERLAAREAQAVPARSTLEQEIIRERQPILCEDYHLECQKRGILAAPEAMLAFAGVPLVAGSDTSGALCLGSRDPNVLYTPNQLALLQAIAGQVAVAIENARLYAHTDQALAARVEELSVMQRIDRELNASLDTSTAMRITLEWAMRQSRADAGLVGVLQGDREGDAAGECLRVMAWQGYHGELVPFETAPLPAADFQLTDAIQDGQPLRRVNGPAAAANGAPFTALLDGGRSQAILPIRREGRTIGLLLLESTQARPLAEETMAFLTRLSDHAAIAIANAQLYAAVQQANLAKSDFVSFVAHELKNPMTSVKGYTELVAAGAVGPVTEAQAGFLGTIKSNIDRMNTLVSDLNDMSKIEVGRLRLDFKSVGLAAAVESVVRSTRKQIEEKQQALRVSVPTGLPPVYADPVRLEQVLVNLISNAHKYTSVGGTVEIAAERSNDCVHIWVRDTGIGIAEDDQKKIFQKFFRSEDPKTRESAGTGLGLNITRSLVEMQGGKIWFESQFRKGTTFHFTVPVAEE